MNKQAKIILALSVSLITLAQAGVWYLAFIYSDNTSALGYVSFSGTLISIILAVLAIGYTYGESVIQKSQSLTLNTQIGILSDVTKKIQIEAESLTELKVIESSLSSISTRISDNFEVTQKGVSTVASKIDAMQRELLNTVSANSHSVESAPLNKLDISKRLLSERNPLTEISVLSIWFLYLVEGKVSDSYLFKLPKIFDKAKIGIEPIYINNSYRDLFFGGIFCQIPILSGLGIIRFADGAISEICSEYTDEIKAQIFNSPTHAGAFYDSVRRELIQEIRTLTMES